MKQKITVIISLVALALIMVLSSCQPVTDDFDRGTGSTSTSSGSKHFFTLTVRAANKRSAGDSLRATVTYEPEVTWESEQGFRSAVTDFVIKVGNEAPQTVQLGASVSSRGMYTVGSDVTVSYEAYGNVTFKNERGKTETKREVIASESKTVKVAAEGTTVNFKVSKGIKTPESYEETVDDGTVKYSAGDATVGSVSGLPDEKEYAPGETVTSPAQVTWDYGDFNGWTANVDLEVTTPNGTFTVQAGNAIAAGSTFTMPDSGVLLTAQWSETEYKITYSPGTGQGAPSQSGFKAINPPDNKVALSLGNGFTKAGEVITGWLAGGDEVGKPNERVSTVELIQMMGGGTTLALEAKWEAKTLYDVTFEEGNQSATQGSMPQNTTTYNGGTISLTPIPTNNFGYEFDGWKVTKTEGGDILTTLGKDDAIYQLNGDYKITLTAQWKGKTYTLSYIKGNGNFPQGNIQNWKDSDTYTVGTSSAITLPTLTATGYQFDGWLIGSETKQGGDTYTPTDNVQATAQWTPDQYTLTFEMGDSSVASPTITGGKTSFTMGETVSFSWSGSRTGYVLNSESSEAGQYASASWSASPAINDLTESSVYSWSFTMPAENVTLTAQWTPITYTITYNAADTGVTGSVLSQNFDITQNGGKVTLSDGTGATKDKYTISKWQYTTSTGTAQGDAGKSGAEVNATDLMAKGGAEVPKPIGTVTLTAVWVPKFSVVIDGAETAYDNFTDAFNAANNNKTATLTMNEDGNYNGSIYSSGGNLTLDLNGHTLTNSYAGPVLNISNGSITLRDSSGNDSGKITTNGNNSGVSVQYSSSSFTMYGGTITGNNFAGAGGVQVLNSATFTMYGGVITGNTSTGNGGGVLVDIDSTFIMEDGTIERNTATQNGGGVFCEAVSPTGYVATFIKKGGTVENNTATGSGSQLFVGEGSKYDIGGGEQTAGTSGFIKDDAF